MVDVKIYTTNTCAYCGMVKKYLDSKGHKYEVVNLDDYPERQDEAFKLSGTLTVPITLVTKSDDTQHVIIGYNLSQLAKALT